jgi:hypothetical protein
MKKVTKSTEQKVAVKKRPIGWLIDRALPATRCHIYIDWVIFQLVICELSPNKVYQKALHVPLMENEENDTPEEFAQAARWLAIIYRDYGALIFGKVIYLAQEVNKQNLEDSCHEKG